MAQNRRLHEAERMTPDCHERLPLPRRQIRVVPGSRFDGGSDDEKADTSHYRIRHAAAQKDNRRCAELGPERPGVPRLPWKELDDAVLVPSDQMPVDFVTLNTRMRVRDLDSNDEESIQLVFPSDANFREGKISILTPVGTALIGYRAGDTVEWRIPSGTRRLRIEEIIYQPEAEGLF